MSKQTVKNEAFLDLESGLVNQLLPVWETYWLTRSREIGFAADEQRWDDAHSLVERVDFLDVLEKRKKAFETLGMASLLLGASRHGRVDRTEVYKNPPKVWLNNAQAQLDVLLGSNATKALRQELHLHIDKREFADSKSNEAGVTDVFKAQQLQPLSKTMRALGAKRGAGYIGLASNLHVSRLSSAGFLIESSMLGQVEYQISAVLDGLTCPVCKRMHGLKFPVKSGLELLGKVFSTTDDEALKKLSPWPAQTKDGLASFGRLDTAGLLDAGYHVPPFHPSCRCILVPTGTIPVLELDTDMALGGILGGLSGLGITPDVLAERMFGNTKDLSDTASVLFGNGATSAMYDLPILPVLAGAATEEATDPDEDNPED